MEKGESSDGVFFGKYILDIFPRFFRCVDKHPFLFRRIIKVQRDVVLLPAFFTHRPQQFDEDGTLEEIDYCAHEVAMLIAEYDREEMDESKALEFVKSVNFKIAVLSRRLDLIRMINGKETERLDLIRMINGKETEQLRVWFDKEDILQPHLDALLGSLPDVVFHIPFEERKSHVSTLARFLHDVEESAAFMVVPVMKQVYDDLALLQAFLIDCPQQLFQDGRLMIQIHYLSQQALLIISLLHVKEMDHSAFERVKFLNCFLKIMSHWMDLIRIIYGKQPKASPYCFVDNLAPLDALLDFLEQSPLKRNTFKRVILLRAILMDPPQKVIEDDRTLKNLEFVAREVGFTISSIDLNNMDEYMAHQMRHRLEHILSGTGLLWALDSKVEEIYAKRPKPSRMYYPKTAQLDFVDLLVDNLGELLVKAKADASIRVLKFDISGLQRELQEASCQLMEIPEPRKEEADLKDNITNIANLAYEGSLTKIQS